MDLLNAIRCFIKIVEAGSIAGGARSLGVSPAAVSQNLARLEQHLQVVLVSRTTRSMALTSAGALYYEKVRHVERDLAQAELAVTTPESEPQGRLVHRLDLGVRAACVGPADPGVQRALSVSFDRVDND